MKKVYRFDIDHFLLMYEIDKINKWAKIMIIQA